MWLSGRTFAICGWGQGFNPWHHKTNKQWQISMEKSDGEKRHLVRGRRLVSFDSGLEVLFLSNGIFCATRKHGGRGEVFLMQNMSLGVISDSTARRTHGRPNSIPGMQYPEWKARKNSWASLDVTHTKKKQKKKKDEPGYENLAAATERPRPVLMGVGGQLRSWVRGR